MSGHARCRGAVVGRQAGSSASSQRRLGSAARGKRSAPRGPEDTEMIERSRYAVPKAVISLCWLGCAGALVSACNDGGGGSRPDDAEAEIEEGGADASPEDAEVAQDAKPAEALDGGATEADAGADD